MASPRTPMPSYELETLEQRVLLSADGVSGLAGMEATEDLLDTSYENVFLEEETESEFGSLDAGVPEGDSLFDEVGGEVLEDGRPASAESDAGNSRASQIGRHTLAGGGGDNGADTAFEIDSTLQRRLEDVLARWDGLLSNLSSGDLLDLEIPGIGISVDEVLAGSMGTGGGGLEDLLKLGSAASDYFASPAGGTATVQGLMDALDAHLAASLAPQTGGGAISNLTVRISGGHFADSEELRIDLDLLATGGMDKTVDSIGGSVASALGALGPVDLSGSFNFNAQATVSTGLSFGLDLGDLSDDPPGLVGVDDAFLRIRNPLAIEVGVGATSLAGTIEIGGASLNLTSDIGGGLRFENRLAFDLTNPDGDPDGNITLEELQGRPITDILEVDASGSLEASFSLSAQLGDLDTADYGFPIIKLSADPLYEVGASGGLSATLNTPEVFIDLQITEGLKTRLLELLDELDAVGQDLFGASIIANADLLNQTIPGIDKSLNQLLDFGGQGIGGALQIKQVAQNFFDSAIGFPTLSGLAETISNHFSSAGASGFNAADPRASGRNFRGQDGSGMDFRGFDFNDSDLRDVNLRGANLAGADFRGADLRNADLTGANIQNALFNGAQLGGASLRGAFAAGADFSGATVMDPSAAEFLDATGLIYDAFTIWWDGLPHDPETGVSVQFLSTVLGQSAIGLKAAAGSLAQQISNRLNGFADDIAEATKWDGYDLSGMDLSGTDFKGLSLVGANLRDADLSNTDFAGVDLTLVNAIGTNFTNALVSAATQVSGMLTHATSVLPDLSMVPDATFRILAQPGADLRHLIERGGHALSLAGHDLSGLDLTGVDFSGLDLSGVNFRGANLAEVIFGGADLSLADLRGVTGLPSGALKGLKLQFANLSGLNLSGFDLSDADLSGAVLRSVRLDGANLDNAVLIAADLTDSIVDGAAQFARTAFDTFSSATLPDFVDLSQATVFKGTEGFEPGFNFDIDGGLAPDGNSITLNLRLGLALEQLFDFSLDESDFGDAARLGLDLDLEGTASAQFGLLMDLDLGVDLTSITSGGAPSTSDIHFVANSLLGNVTLSVAGVSADVGLEGIAGIEVEKGSLTLTAGSSVNFVPQNPANPDDERITLQNVLDIKSASSLADLVIVTPGGALEGSLHVAGNFGSFDLADFGFFILILEDDNLLDSMRPRVSIDFEIGSTLEGHILKLLTGDESTDGLDDFADTISSNAAVTTSIPVVDKSLNDLLKSDGLGPVWGDFIKFGPAVETWFASFDTAGHPNHGSTPTMSGLVQVLIDDVLSKAGTAFTAADGGSILNLAGGLFNEGGSKVLRFDVDFNGGLDTVTHVNFGSIGDVWEALGVEINSELAVKLRAAMDMAFSFGVDLTGGLGSPAFFFDIPDAEPWHIDISLDGSGSEFDFMLGPVGGMLTAEKLFLGAGVDIAFDGDPTSGSPTITPVQPLNESQTPINMLDVMLRLDAMLGGASIITPNGDLSNLPSVSISDANLFEDPKPSFTSSLAELGNFRNFGPEQILDTITFVGNFLNQFRSSSVFEVPIPFTELDLGDVFDFAKYFNEQVISFLQTTDGNGNPAAAFDTFDQFGNQLEDILDPDDLLGLDLDPNYNGSDEVTFTVSFTPAIPHVEVPIGFDLDLSPLGNITSEGNLLLEAGVTLTFTLGMNVDTQAEILEIESVAAMDLRESGRLSSDTTFEVRIDGRETDAAYTPITITAASTSDNQGSSDLPDDQSGAALDDLVADINAAIATAGLGSQLAAESVGGMGFRFKTLNPASDLEIRVASEDSLAHTELGLPLEIRDHKPGFEGFIENASLTGSVALKGNDIKLGADLGFLGLALTDINGTLTDNALLNGGLSIDIVDPANPTDKRLTFTEIKSFIEEVALSNAGENDTSMLSFSPADLFDLTLTGGAGIRLAGLTVSGGFIPDNLIPGNAGIVIELQQDGGTVLDLTNPSGIAPDVRLENLDLLNDFGSFGFSDLLNGFTSVVQWLAGDPDDPEDQGLQAFGFLNERIPLLNKSLNELLDHVTVFADAVAEFESNPAAALEFVQTELQTILDDLIGKDSEGNSRVTLVLEPVYDDPGTPTTLEAIKIGLEVPVFALDESFALNLNLKELGALTGNTALTETLAKMESLVDIDAMAMLAFNADVVLNIDLGIDMQNGYKPFLFDTTGVNVTGSLAGNELNFTASLGPVDAGIVDGMAVLNRDGVFGSGNDFLFRFGVVDDNSDGRVFFDDFSAFSETGTRDLLDAVGATVQAVGSIDLPMEAAGISLGNLKLNLDLNKLFRREANAITVVETPSIADLFQNLSLLNIVNNPMVLISGVDKLLEGIQNTLTSELAQTAFPIIGDALKDAATFIEDFRVEVIGRLQTALDDAGGSLLVLIQQQLFKLFGPDGLLFSEGSPFRSLRSTGILLDGDTPFNGDDTPNFANDFNDVVLRFFDESGAEVTPATPGQVPSSAKALQFNLHLHQDLLDESLAIDFDLGLDGLPLELSVDEGSKIRFQLGWDFEFGFGITESGGLFLDTTPENELEIFFTVTVPDFSATGILTFMEAFATDIQQDGEFTSFKAEVLVDLKDPGTNAQDGRLMVTAGELTGGIVELRINATADINLGLELGVKSSNPDDPGASSFFPKLLAELYVDWTWGVGFGGDASMSTKDLKGSAPTVMFKNVGLDLGSFATDVLKPVLDQISGIVGPVKDVLDTLDEPIPGISDIAGEDISVLGLLEKLEDSANGANIGFDIPGLKFELDIRKLRGLVAFVFSIKDTVDMVVALADALIELEALAAGGNIVIPFGQFGALYNEAKKGYVVDMSNAEMDDFNSDNLAAELGQPESKVQKTKNFFSKVKKSKGLSLDILKPSNIFDLILGDDVNIISYNFPKFTVDIGLLLELNIPPVEIPSPLRLTGGFEGDLFFEADVGFGFDTSGIREFVDVIRSGKELEPIDYLLPLNGLFLRDTARDGSGRDVDELVLDGFLKLYGSLDVTLIKASASGRLDFFGRVDLVDPDKDGKLRVKEIRDILGDLSDFSKVLDLFNIDVVLEADLRARVDSKLPVPRFEFRRVCDPTPISGAISSFFGGSGEPACVDVPVPVGIDIVEVELWSDSWKSKFVDFHHRGNNGPPELASIDNQGRLKLNVGDRAVLRGSGDANDNGEEMTVTQSGGTLTVSGYDHTMDFEVAQVTQIIAATGEGDDIIRLSGIQVPVIFSGGPGNDTLIANGATTGTLTIDGGAGTNSLTGGAGTNFFLLNAASGTHNVSSRNGRDILSASEIPVVVDLGRLRAEGSGGQQLNASPGFFEAVMGGGSFNTLQGPNTANSWTLSGDRSGQVGGVTFSGFDQLVGGSLQDTLFVPDESADWFIEGHRQLSRGEMLFTDMDLIVGGALFDRVRGGNEDTEWRFVANDRVQVAGMEFTDFDEILGGSGKDTFIFQGAGTFDGFVDGLGGVDTLDYSRLTSSITVDRATRTASRLGAQFFGIDRVVGSQAADTLIGERLANTWEIQGRNQGRVSALKGAGIMEFSGVENLAGNSLSDTFMFEAGADITGNLDGGGANDTLDYSDRTQSILVDLERRVATGVSGSFSSIERVVGGEGIDRLIGQREPTTWRVMAENSGDLFNQSGTTFVRFEGIETLQGGASDDQFFFADDANITGYLHGGQGRDTINLSAWFSPVTVNRQMRTATGVGLNYTGLENAIGGRSGEDLLIGEDQNATWTINGFNSGFIGSPATFAFQSFEIPTGGSANDLFLIDTAGVITGEIRGRSAGAFSGTDTIDGRLLSEIVTYRLAATDAGTVTTGAGSSKFAFFANLVGGPANDRFLIGPEGRSTGLLDGSGGDRDVLSYEEWTASVSVDLAVPSATNVNQLTSIDDATGGAGADTLKGNANVNVLRGGPGADTISGFDGEDMLHGDDGNDTLHGGNHNDMIFGGAGDDTLNGDSGNDHLEGGLDNDTLTGGIGDDVLVGGLGDDLLQGGDGDDVLWGGVEELPFSAFDRSVPSNYTLPPGTTLVNNSFPAQFAHNPTFLITPAAVEGKSLDGVLSDGVDTLEGEGGNDVLFGGSDNDAKLDGGADADYVDAGAGNDVNVLGGAGDDVVRGGAGNDLVHGNDGIDQVYGDDGDDILFGDDYLIQAGVQERQRLFGGAGRDTLEGSTPSINIANIGNQLFGDDGSGFQIGDGADILKGGNLDDLLAGGPGNELILGGLGNDFLFGDSGEDDLFGGPGNDELWGGPGSDSLDGQDGVDKQYGGSGIDFFQLDTSATNGEILKGHHGNRTEGDAGQEGVDGVPSATDVLVIRGTNGDDTILLSHTVPTDGSQPRLRVDFKTFTVFAEWLRADGTPELEQFQVAGLGGDDVIGFAGYPGAPLLPNTQKIDLTPLIQRSNDLVAKFDGNSGNDILIGSVGRDQLDGGPGSDLIYGFGGDDVLSGDSFDGFSNDVDVIFAGQGNDDLLGGQGSSYLFAWSMDPYGPLHFQDGAKGATLNAFAPQNPLGRLERDATFTLLVDGAASSVTLTAASTADNTSIADLIADLDAQLPANVSTGKDSAGRLTLTHSEGATLQFKAVEFGVFVDADGALHDDSGDFLDNVTMAGTPDGLIDGTTDPARQREDTGINRILGQVGPDHLFGGTGIDFLYGNGGNDTLYRNDGSTFESLDGGLGGDDWKEYAKESDQVWYVAGSNADDEIAVDFVTEPGVLANHHLVTRLTGNNGNFSFAAQIRLDFNATDDNGNFIWDPAQTVLDAEEFRATLRQLRDDPDNALLAEQAARTEMRLAANILPPEGDFMAIIIDALDGNDIVNVGPTVQKTVWVDGGAGDDRIEIRSGNAILVDTTENVEPEGQLADRNDRPSHAFDLPFPAALRQGVRFTGLTIDNPSDVDWYRFKLSSIPAGTTISLLGASPNDNLTLSIVAPDDLETSLAVGSLTAGTEYLLKVESDLRPTIYEIHFDLDATDTSTLQFVDLGLRTDSIRRDVLLGGSGNDVLLGGAGEDWIFGGDGDDVLSGGQDRGARDLLFGGAGNDTYQIIPDFLPVLRPGDPTIQTEEGLLLPTYHDQFIEQDNAGTDQVLFLGGDLDRRGLPVPDFVALRYNTLLHRYEFTNLIWDIFRQEFALDYDDANSNGRIDDGETVNGFQQQFYFYQARGVERTVISTGQGDDTVHAGGGFRFLPVTPNGTNDKLILDATANAALFEEWGLDVGDFEQGARAAKLLILGGDGNDVLWGGPLDDTIDGGSGDDFIAGGLGNDEILGGGGDDRIFGRAPEASDAIHTFPLPGSPAEQVTIPSPILSEFHRFGLSSPFQFAPDPITPGIVLSDVALEEPDQTADLLDSFALTGNIRNEQLRSIEKIGDFNGDGRDDYIVTGRDYSYVLLRPLELDEITTIDEVAEIIIDHSVLGTPIMTFGDINGDGTNDLVFVKVDAEFSYMARLTVIMGGPYAYQEGNTTVAWPRIWDQGFVDNYIMDGSSIRDFARLVNMEAFGDGPGTGVPSDIQVMNWNADAYGDLLIRWPVELTVNLAGSGMTSGIGVHWMIDGDTINSASGNELSFMTSGDDLVSFVIETAGAQPLTLAQTDLTYMRAFNVGDYNGDRIDDIILAYSSGDFSNDYSRPIFWGGRPPLADGREPFFLMGHVSVPREPWVATALGDLNNDIYREFAFISAGDGEVNGSIGIFDGYDAAASQLELDFPELPSRAIRLPDDLPTNAFTQVTAGDFNGDRLLDLAVADENHPTEPGIHVFLDVANLPLFNPNFENSVISLSQSDATIQVPVGFPLNLPVMPQVDVNDDGLDDVLITSPKGGDLDAGAVYALYGERRRIDLPTDDSIQDLSNVSIPGAGSFITGIGLGEEELFQDGNGPFALSDSNVERWFRFSTLGDGLSGNSIRIDPALKTGGNFFENNQVVAIADIFDAAGRLVAENRGAFDLRILEAGTYYIRVHPPEIQYTKKAVKFISIGTIDGAADNRIISTGKEFSDGDIIIFNPASGMVTVDPSELNIFIGEDYFVINSDPSDGSFQITDTFGGAPVDFDEALLLTTDLELYPAFFDDSFFIPNHGLSNGDTVIFTNPPAPLEAGTRYHIVDATPFLFRVAATSGGTNIKLAEAGPPLQALIKDTNYGFAIAVDAPIRGQTHETSTFPDADVIRSGDGNDIIHGNNDIDAIFSGSGSDTVNAELIEIRDGSAGDLRQDPLVSQNSLQDTPPDLDPIIEIPDATLAVLIAKALGFADADVLADAEREPYRFRASQLATVTTLDLNGMDIDEADRIRDLTGIEYLINLRWLNLEEMNVGNNSSLNPSDYDQLAKLKPRRLENGDRVGAEHLQFLRIKDLERGALSDYYDLIDGKRRFSDAVLDTLGSFRDLRSLKVPHGISSTRELVMTDISNTATHVSFFAPVNATSTTYKVTDLQGNTLFTGTGTLQIPVGAVESGLFLVEQTWAPGDGGTGETEIAPFVIRLKDPIIIDGFLNQSLPETPRELAEGGEIDLNFLLNQHFLQNQTRLFNFPDIRLLATRFGSDGGVADILDLSGTRLEFNVNQFFQPSGTDDVVYLSPDAFNGLSNLSLMFWLSSAEDGSSNRRQTLLSGANGSQGDEFRLDLVDSNTWELTLKGNTVSWDTGDIDFNGGGENNFHHIGLTLNADANMAELYVDGQSLGTRAIAVSALAIDSQGFVIGQDLSAPGTSFTATRHYNGSFDELSVWNRVLDPGEVAQYMNRTIYVGADLEATYARGPESFFVARKRPLQDLVQQNESLLHHYTFDDEDQEDFTSIVDVARGNNGTLQGGSDIALGGAFGNVGDHFVLDGVDDYLELPNSVALTDDYSVEAFFKTSSAGAIVAGTQAGSALHGILIEITSTGVLRYLHRVPFGSAGLTTVVAQGDFRDGAWHHLVAVRSGNELRLYVDGELANSKTDNDDFPGPMDIVVGRLSKTNEARPFNGSIDEVAIYTQALDEAEIKLHYETAQQSLQFGGDVQGLNAYWRFQQAATNLVEPDLSGNGHFAFLGTGSSDTDIPAVFAGSPLSKLRGIDDGSYDILFRILSPDDKEVVARRKVIVVNADPTAAITGDDRTVNAGSPVVLDGSGSSDPGVNDTLTYNWTVSSNNGDVIAAGTGRELAFTPKYAGTYTVSLVVNDDDGGESSADSVVVTVNPAVDLDGPAGNMFTEGDVVTFDLSDSTSLPVVVPALDAIDPLNPPTHTRVIEWRVNGVLQTGETGLIFEWVVPDEGNYAVSATIRDTIDGTTYSDTAMINNLMAANAAPAVGAQDNVTIEEGTLSLALNLNDPGTGDALMVTVNWGEGGPAQILNNVPAGILELSHDYLEMGIYNVTVDITDGVNAGSQMAFMVTVTNAAPVVNAGMDRQVMDGFAVTFNGSFTDIGTDVHSVVWDFGDGTQMTGTLTPTHTFARLPGDTNNDGVTNELDLLRLFKNLGNGALLPGDDLDGDFLTTQNDIDLFMQFYLNDELPAKAMRSGEFLVTLTVTDNEGGVTTDTVRVQVGNQAPQSFGLNVSAPGSEGSGSTFDLGVPVTFSGNTTDFDAVFGFLNPGDGSQIPLRFTEVVDPFFGTSYNFSASHAYEAEGDYNATATLMDADGGVTVLNQMVTIEAPAAITDVTVSGSGWSQSFRSNLPIAGFLDGKISLLNVGEILDALPWSGIDTVTVTFSEPVSVRMEHLAVFGNNTGAYAFSGFESGDDSFTKSATWTLATPLQSDTFFLQVSSDVMDQEFIKSIQGRRLFEVDVRPGDVNQDGTVDSTDRSEILINRDRLEFSRNPLADIDGSGVIDAADADIVLGMLEPGTFASANVPLTIPTFGAESAFVEVVSTVEVSGAADFILDANVRLDITHSYAEDLEVWLVSPAGTRVDLFGVGEGNGIGGSGDNFNNTVLDDEALDSIEQGTAPFTGSFRPQGSLSALDGENPNGTWTLHIRDHFAQDGGQLNQWSLELLLVDDLETGITTQGYGGYLALPPSAVQAQPASLNSGVTSNGDLDWYFQADDEDDDRDDDQIDFSMSL